MADEQRAPATPVKDETAEHPVAVSWRPVLRRVVAALAQGNYAPGVSDVEPLSAEVAAQIRESIESYGATLTDLPEESWQSSVAQWMGTHWEVLVDLWTTEEGRSDLVLRLAVAEEGDRYRFKVEMVYVP